MNSNIGQNSRSGWFCFRIFLVGILVALFQQAVYANEFGDYPVLTMPLVEIAPGEQIAWIDNRRLIFSGHNREHRNKTSLFRWDISSEVEKIFDYARGFCFDGQSIYVFGDLNANKLKRFQISAPDFSTSIDIEIPSYNSPAFFNKHTCRNQVIPKALLGRIWVAIGDYGYLDFGSAESASGPIQVALISNDGKSRQDIDLTLRQPIAPTIIPIQHKKTFFVHNMNIIPDELERWRNSGFLDAWYIKSNGDVETIAVPAGPWVTSGDILILPIRNGLAIVSHGINRDGTPESAGVYRIANDGSSKQLISGFVDHPEVSPDGCRLAFAFQRRLDFEPGKTYSPPIRKLVVINLCSQGE